MQTETYVVRASIVARLREEVMNKHISLPMINAFRAPVEEHQHRIVTSIERPAQDKAARIEMIRQCHRRAARAGMFDHCWFQGHSA